MLGHVSVEHGTTRHGGLNRTVEGRREPRHVVLSSAFIPRRTSRVGLGLVGLPANHGVAQGARLVGGRVAVTPSPERPIEQAFIFALLQAAGCALSPATVFAACKDRGLAHQDCQRAVWDLERQGAIVLTADWRICAAE